MCRRFQEAPRGGDSTVYLQLECTDLQSGAMQSHQEINTDCSLVVNCIAQDFSQDILFADCTLPETYQK